MNIICFINIHLLPGCENGTYGYNCLKNCSGHCVHGYPCNKETGRCDEGCEPGYSDTFCSKSWFIISLNIIKDLKKKFFRK